MNFQPNVFNYNAERDQYVVEFAELQRKSGIVRCGRVLTIEEKPLRHFCFEKADQSGENITGWWYNEIGGKGKVLIIND